MTSIQFISPKKLEGIVFPNYLTEDELPEILTEDDLPIDLDDFIKKCRRITVTPINIKYLNMVLEAMFEYRHTILWYSINFIDCKICLVPNYTNRETNLLYFNTDVCNYIKLLNKELCSILNLTNKE